MTDTTTWRRNARDPRQRGGWIVALLSFVTLGFYYAYWIYRLHAETPARVRVDASPMAAVLLPIAVGVMSLIPISASGAFGAGEVNLALFSGGMAINFVAHVLYLRTTLRLTERFVGLSGACRLDPARLRSGKQSLTLGVFAIALENVGLKSAELLSLDVPSWVQWLDSVLLLVGIYGLCKWSSACLQVANAFAANKAEACTALGVAD